MDEELRRWDVPNEAKAELGRQLQKARLAEALIGLVVLQLEVMGLVILQS